MLKPCRVAISGTDTDVGKTHVCQLLVHGLRAHQRAVWVHKPVSCGEWDGTHSEDGRHYRTMVADGQAFETACPIEFEPACSPHIAARTHGRQVKMPQLIANAQRCVQANTDLVLEGAGGLLAPLGTDDGDLTALCQALNLPLLVVTRPDLGTINHTRLTVAHAQRCGLGVLGLVVNHSHAPTRSLATEGIGAELARLCAVPLLAECPYAPELDVMTNATFTNQAMELAAAVRHGVVQTS